MSWLISLVVAGLMFTSESRLPATVNHNFSESKPRVEETKPFEEIERFEDSKRFDETERFSQTYPLSATGKVSVSNVNGSVTIETWDRNEVKLEYVKVADTREQLASFQVKIEANANSFSAETDYDDNYRNGGWKNRGKSTVEYTLVVPQNAILDEIATVNGSISIANAANSTKASSVNGQVKATNLRGAAKLSTVNGTVSADFDRLQTGSRISLDTVNGHADLIIPSDANAIVKADTVNGGISNDFGLPIRKGEYVGKNLYGKIGSGDVQIRLNSVNGALSVKRKNDGKSLNPATNLLSTKNEEDWDDDADGDSAVRAPRAPRTPRAPGAPRAPRSPNPPQAPGNVFIDEDELNKTIQDGMKQAQKEMENIRPELEKAMVDGMKQSASIRKEELQQRMKEAQEKYKEAFARMSEINWSNGVPSVAEKSGSFAVRDTPKITIEAGNAEVVVRGWDKPEVSYSVTRISQSRSLAPLDVRATQNDSDISIKFAGQADAAENKPDKNFGKFFFDRAKRIRIEVFVPRKSDLKIAGGGEIRLENISGAVDLQGANESINVRDGGGKLTAETAGGKIRVIGFSGQVNAKTDDGAINLEGDFHGLSARTTGGAIILTLPENANANIESNRKNIVGEGILLKPQTDGKSVSTWKIGGGGENYQLYAAAGRRVTVRGVKQLQN